MCQQICPMVIVEQPLTRVRVHMLLAFRANGAGGVTPRDAKPLSKHMFRWLVCVEQHVFSYVARRLCLIIV